MCNQKGSGYYFNLSENSIGGQPDIVTYPDANPPALKDMTGGNRGYNDNQYNFITDSDTKKIYNIFEKNGINLLRNLIKSCKNK